MKKILILCLLLMFSLPCFAETWVQVGKNEHIDVDSISVFKDDSGKVYPNKKMFWLKIENKNGMHKSFEKLFKTKISYSKNLCVIDIKNKERTFKAYKFYDKNEEFLIDYIEKDAKLKWSPIYKNSNGDFWYKVITDEKLRQALIKAEKAKKKR